MKRRLKTALWIALAVGITTAPVLANLFECMAHFEQVLEITKDQNSAQDAFNHCCAVEGCAGI